MGLDWNPIGKAKPGHEEEFEHLFHRLGELPVNVGAWERLKRRLRGIDRDALDRRWREIQITTYETLGAPRVGTDAPADDWARARYREQEHPAQSEAQFMPEMQGYYVLALAPPCDGMPCYSNGAMGYVEASSFRAQFLAVDCEDIIGPNTLEKCYHSCLAPGLAALGHELRGWAISYAGRHGVSQVEGRPVDAVGEGPERKAHILFCAARWCEYWSSRGHGLEAYW